MGAYWSETEDSNLNKEEKKNWKEKKTQLGHRQLMTSGHKKLFTLKVNGHKLT